MANLKWTIDLKLNDVSVANVPHSMEVERKWNEVVLQVGKKARSVTVEGEGKLVLLTVQAKNAKKDTVLLEIGKSKIMLNKPVLFTSGVSGFSNSKQETYEILRSKPGLLKFTNKSQSPVTVEIQSAWQAKAGKKAG